MEELEASEEIVNYTSFSPKELNSNNKLILEKDESSLEINKSDVENSINKNVNISSQQTSLINSMELDRSESSSLNLNENLSIINAEISINSIQENKQNIQGDLITIAKTQETNANLDTNTTAKINEIESSLVKAKEVNNLKNFEAQIVISESNNLQLNLHHLKSDVNITDNLKNTKIEKIILEQNSAHHTKDLSREIIFEKSEEYKKNIDTNEKNSNDLNKEEKKVITNALDSDFTYPNNFSNECVLINTNQDTILKDLSPISGHKITFEKLFKSNTTSNNISLNNCTPETDKVTELIKISPIQDNLSPDSYMASASPMVIDPEFSEDESQDSEIDSKIEKEFILENVDQKSSSMSITNKDEEIRFFICNEESQIGSSDNNQPENQSNKQNTKQSVDTFTEDDEDEEDILMEINELSDENSSNVDKGNSNDAQVDSDKIIITDKKNLELSLDADAMVSLPVEDIYEEASQDMSSCIQNDEESNNFDVLLPRTIETINDDLTNTEFSQDSFATPEKVSINKGFKKRQQSLSVAKLQKSNSAASISGSAADSLKSLRKRRTINAMMTEGNIVSFKNATNIFEFQWPSDRSGEWCVLQEHISEYLGVVSFKRKYPDISRRPVGYQERQYLSEQGFVTEMQCDMGLTVLKAEDVYDLMAKDYPEKYQEYNKVQHRKIRIVEKIELNLSDKLKAEVAMKKAVKMAARYNAKLMKEKRADRKTFFDLQTMEVHYPIRMSQKILRHLPTPLCNSYPIAIIPGQFQEYYKKYSPEELNYLPVNTALYSQPRVVSSLYADPVSTASDNEESFMVMEPMTYMTSKDIKFNNHLNINGLVMTKTLINNAVLLNSEESSNPALYSLPSASNKDKKLILDASATGMKSPDNSTNAAFGERSTDVSGTPSNQMVTPGVKKRGRGLSAVKGFPVGRGRKSNSSLSITALRCGMCDQRDRNKFNLLETMIKCSTCLVSNHPTCISISPEMVPLINTYAWQCIECKTCFKCTEPHDEDKMMFCDLCDRGYHTYCLGLTTIPEGRWECGGCYMNGTPVPVQPKAKRGRPAKIKTEVPLIVSENSNASNSQSQSQSNFLPETSQSSQISEEIESKKHINLVEFLANIKNSKVVTRNGNLKSQSNVSSAAGEIIPNECSSKAKLNDTDSQILSNSETKSETDINLKEPKISDNSNDYQNKEIIYSSSLIVSKSQTTDSQLLSKTTKSEIDNSKINTLTIVNSETKDVKKKGNTFNNNISKTGELNRKQTPDLLSSVINNIVSGSIDFKKLSDDEIISLSQTKIIDASEKEKSLENKKIT